MSEQIIHATDDTFDSEVLQSQVPVLLDYWAEWCGPCKMIAPVLQDPFGLPPSFPGVVTNVASGGFPGLGREEQRGTRSDDRSRDQPGCDLRYSVPPVGHDSPPTLISHEFRKLDAGRRPEDPGMPCGRNLKEPKKKHLLRRLVKKVLIQSRQTSYNFV